MAYTPRGGPASPPEVVTDLRSAASAVLVAAVVLYAFLPLLRGEFFLDDLVHLYDLTNFGLLKLLLAPQMGHPQVLTGALFAALYALFGVQPTGWFVAVLALHAVNAVLFFRLLRTLSCGRVLAAAWVLLWAVNPVQRETLAWLVGSGQALVVTCMLVVLTDLFRAGHRGEGISRRRLGIWFLLGVACAASHGVGIGAAAVLWLMAWLVLPPAPTRVRAVSALASLVVVAPTLLLALHATHHWLFGTPLYHAAPGVSLSLASLPSLVRETVRFGADLLSFGCATLLLGGPVSVPVDVAGGAAAAAPALAVFRRLHVLAVVAALAAGWSLRADPERRRWALALVVLALGVDGSIALGSIASGRTDALVALVGAPAASAYLAAAARYHYVTTLCLAAVGALSLDTVRRAGRWQRRGVGVAVTVTLVAIGLRVHADRKPGRGGALFVFHHDALARLGATAARLAPGETLYVRNQMLGRGLVAAYDAAFPGWAAMSVVFLPNAAIAGHPVRFVESDPTLLAAIRAHPDTPIARRVVGPGEVPADAVVHAP